MRKVPDKAPAPANRRQRFHKPTTCSKCTFALSHRIVWRVPGASAPTMSKAVCASALRSARCRPNGPWGRSTRPTCFARAKHPKQTCTAKVFPASGPPKRQSTRRQLNSSSEAQTADSCSPPRVRATASSRRPTSMWTNAARRDVLLRGLLLKSFAGQLVIRRIGRACPREARRHVLAHLRLHQRAPVESTHRDQNCSSASFEPRCR